MLLLLALFCLAGRVFALNVTVGGNLGTIDAINFLNVTSACQSQCTPATNALSTCTNDTCLCDANTLGVVRDCQQCLFDDLVANFATTNDPRVGSTALTAYAAACSSQASVVVPPTSIALTLPTDWNGPFGVSVHTTLVGTVFTIAAGVALGSGAVLIFATM